MSLISHAQDVPPGALDDAQPQEYPADLPPFGSIGEDPSTHGQAVAYLMRIGEVAAQARADKLERAENNAKVYEWGQTIQPCDGDVVANDIQTQVLSITDIQTREPFNVLIRPVQTREKSPMFWIGPPVDEMVAALTGLPVGIGMEPVIDPMTGQPAMQPVMDEMGAPLTDQMGQPAMQPVMQPATSYQPLNEVLAWQIKKMAATGAFPSEWFVVLDDRLVSDVYQTVFDVFWEEAHLDDFVRENVLKTNIFGYQTSTYSWDVQQKKHLVRDVSIAQAFLDPQAEGSNFDLQNCPGYEVVMDVDQAKAEWPQLADLIDEKATPGNPKRVDSYSEFGIASDRDFKQRTVTFRIHWFRNQTMPMTPEEAEGAGLVVRTQNAITGEEEFADARLFAEQGVQPDAPAVDAGLAAAPVAEPSNETIGASGPTGAGDAALRPGDADGLGGQAAGVPAPAGNGIGDAQPGPSWPMTRGIRQMATLAQTDRIVQDIRCEYWDIPMLLNVCIPLASQPFGQGLPEKLKGMQQAKNRLLAATVNYAERFTVPGAMVPQTVADALQKGLKTMHVDPSKTYNVPDDLIRQWGDKAILWFTPPPMPPAVAQVMEILEQQTDKTSGHPEVMSGTAPSPTSSGRMVEALQSAAAGQFGFQAQWTGKMVQRLANLMHYSHLWRLDLPDLMQIYSRLPEQIMEMVIDRARRGRWDVQVEASQGMGNKKLNKALALFASRSNTGEPALPLQGLREAANIDHEEASIQYRTEVQSAMPGPAMPVGAGAPQPGSAAPRGANGENGQHASNGNGRM